MTLPPKAPHADFLLLIDAMSEKLARMEQSPAVAHPFHLGILIPKGVYVFYMDGKAQYAGRSNCIPKRLREHSNIGSGFRSAAFAMRIARVELGLKPVYNVRRSAPAHVSKNPLLKQAFARAKEQIRSMSVRVIEEADPTRQALLEIYVATRLGCPYNDFDNH